MCITCCYPGLHTDTLGYVPGLLLFVRWTSLGRKKGKDESSLLSDATFHFTFSPTLWVCMDSQTHFGSPVQAFCFHTASSKNLLLETQFESLPMSSTYYFNERRGWPGAEVHILASERPSSTPVVPLSGCVNMSNSPTPTRLSLFICQMGI